MPQTEAPSIQISEQHLQWMGAMLCSPADEWEKQYWQRRVNETLAEQEGSYPTFSFTYEQRSHFYRFVNSKILGNAPIDYLEFGVFMGNSIRSWLGLNRNETSTFHGFDCFEGLPENWKEGADKGAYSAGGNTPQVDDDRCTFVAGLFQDTLPDFVESFDPKNRLVIHMDADLYSSTFYGLAMLDRFIKPGTVILFDEFLSKGGSHEFAALYDYGRTYYKKWKFIAAREDHTKLAIEILP